MIGRGVYGFGHLGEMLKEVAVHATPDTLAEHSSLLDLVKEFRRQQDVVNLLRRLAVAECDLPDFFGPVATGEWR